MNPRKKPPAASTALRPPLTYPLPFRAIPEALEAAPGSEPFVTMWKSEEEEQTVTFSEFRALVSEKAAFLREHGVTSADTVILVMPQGISLMAVFVAAMYVGAIPTIVAEKLCDAMSNYCCFKERWLQTPPVG